MTHSLAYDRQRYLRSVGEACPSVTGAVECQRFGETYVFTDFGEERIKLPYPI